MTARLPASLRRETSSAPLLREMDGLRLLPLLMVIVLHFMHRLCIMAPAGLVPDPADSMLMAVSQKGDAGVQVFFAISGFVLALPFARQFLCGGRNVDPRRFYLRRLVRLEGPLFINLAVHVLVLAVILHKYPLPLLAGQFLPTWGCWFRSTTGAPSLINSVAWSLEPELQFCLLMPLICQGYRIGNPGLRRGLIALTILIPPFFKPLFNPAHLPAQIEYFMVGLLLADWHLAAGSRPAGATGRLWTWAGAAAFAGMLGCLAARRHFELLSNLAMPWVLLTGLAGVLKSPLWKPLFSHPLPALLGGWCYSIYLYHILIINMTLAVLFKLAPLNSLHAAFWLFLPACLVAVTLVCVVLYAVAESPFIHLASRLAGKRRETAPLQPSAAVSDPLA